MAGKNALGFGGNANSNWVKGVATFKFKDGTNKVKIKLDKDSFVITDDMLPEKPEKIDGGSTDKNGVYTPGEEYFVELKTDEDKESVEEVVSIRPVQWMGLKMKCVDFTHNENDEPSFYEKTATYNGKEVTYSAFTAFMECLDGEFEGVRFPYWMHYKFENDPENKGFARWSGNPDNPKATRLRQVVDFMVTMGAVNEPVEWPDDGNILPELLARIKAAGVVVETAGKDGYITEMIESKVKVPAKKEEKASFNDEVKKEDADDDENW